VPTPSSSSTDRCPQPSWALESPHTPFACSLTVCSPTFLRALAPHTHLHLLLQVALCVVVDLDEVQLLLGGVLSLHGRRQGGEACWAAGLPNLRTNTRIHTHTRTHAHIHTHAHTHTYTHTNAHTPHTTPHPHTWDRSLVRMSLSRVSSSSFLCSLSDSLPLASSSASSPLICSFSMSRSWSTCGACRAWVR